MKRSAASLSSMPLWAWCLGSGLLLAVWLLRKALAPFFLAMVLAFLLEPAVARLARRMPRARAVLLVFAGSFATLAMALRLTLPVLLEQAGRLLASIPGWKQLAESRFGPWLAAHPALRDKLQGAAESLDPVGFLKGLWGAGADLLAGFLQAMTFLLVPVIVYYLMVEGRSVLTAAEDLLPPRHRERMRTVATAIHQRLGGYIRGQLAVAAAMALLQGLAFQFLAVPNAWLLGLVAGISNVVPYSPYLTALVPALVLASLANAPWPSLVLLAAVFTAVQKLEAFYFTPVWVGRASHLHPLEVLLATLCFGFAFGLLGLVFAVPLMIVVKAVAETLLQDYKTHPWYRGDPSAAEG